MRQKVYKNGIHFVLAINCWTWGLPLSASDIPNKTLLEKMIVALQAAVNCR